MKNLFALVLMMLAPLALITPAPAAQASPEIYQVDPDHSFVTSEVKHFGTSTLRVRYKAQTGTVTVDWAARSGRAELYIDMASLDTGIEALDLKLKSAEFFSVADYPQARFTSDGFTFDPKADSKVVTGVHGNLTIRDQSIPVMLTSRGFNCYLNPLLRREVCGGDFETTFKRSALHINSGLPFVGDDVHLLIQIEAIRLPAQQ